MTDFFWQTCDTDQWCCETKEFGCVILQCIDDGDGDEFEEWDICINDCWQGPFDSRHECIEHLKVCIKEKEEG